MDKFKDKYRIDSARAHGWDYSMEGAYFITICSDGHECIFGKIQNKEMILSKIGEIAQQEWEKSFDIRKELFCDLYVIMPNHIHSILRIDYSEYFFPVQKQDIESNEIYKPCFFEKDHGVAFRSPKSISTFVGGFKSSVTKRINKHCNPQQETVWQSRFHDHIIRDRGEYIKIRNYIESNPKNWEQDRFYRE